MSDGGRGDGADVDRNLRDRLAAIDLELRDRSREGLLNQFVFHEAVNAMRTRDLEAERDIIRSQLGLAPVDELAPPISRRAARALVAVSIVCFIGAGTLGLFAQAVEWRATGILLCAPAIGLGIWGGRALRHDGDSRFR